MRWINCTLIAAAVWLALPCAAQAARSGRFQGQVHVVKRGETLGEIAQHYRVSVAQLREWNQLRNDRIRAGQRLKIARLPEWHLVKKGDTLARIARTYGLGVDRLKQLNRLADDRIAAGQKLRIAAPAESSRARTDTALAAQSAPEVLLEDLTADRIPPPPPEEEGPPLEYTVEPGDSLGQIARRFAVSLSLLRQLNHLEKDRIRPGQKLRLRPSPLDEGIHVVRPGDTLTGIARRYDLGLEQLREINGIEGSKILIGQKLRLKPTPTGVHIVERGDALWEIASAYGMDTEELKRLNDLTSDQIYPGQELKLSAKKAETVAFYTVERGDNLSEIARLHQMIDLEGAHRKEAEKYAEERARKTQALEQENHDLKAQLKVQEAAFQEKTAQLRERLEAEIQKLREQLAAKEKETDIRVATLRQELDEKQRQRAETTEQNARLAEKVARLEKTIEEQAGALEQQQARIAELEEEKKRLQRDLNKIMGNLTRW